jgi:enolase 1/2/3
MSEIRDVRARRVWDSRGRPTVEAEIELASGAVGRAIAPSGASTGTFEAAELRDGGPALRGLDVQAATANVRGAIREALVGRQFPDQTALDRRLIKLDGTPKKSRLGANAVVAVSLAFAHARAVEAKQPLWRHLAGAGPVCLPLPEVQIYGGGAHAHGRIDIQDFLVIPVGATHFAQALEWAAEIYYAAGARLAGKGKLAGVADEGGYWPSFSTNAEALEELTRAIEDAGLKAGRQAAIALDIAATQLYREGRYHLALETRALDAAALGELLGTWIDAFPIVSIEDPFAEADHEAMRSFTAAYGSRLQIVGDDYFVTDAARIAAGIRDGACNTVLLKPNQIGTLTETRAALDVAREGGYGAIVSARSGESEDVTIVHLAVGWGVPQLKVGSFARSERMAKWNEGLRIEEALGGPALSPASCFPWRHTADRSTIR